jgi:hypothetical protein
MINVQNCVSYAIRNVLIRKHFVKMGFKGEFEGSDGW